MKNSGLIKLLILLMLIIGRGLTTYSQFSYWKLLREYRDSGYLCNDFNYSIYQIVNNYTKDTRFEDRFNLNDTVDANSLNVFVFSKDPKEAFPNLVCNCAYIGYENTIVCDAKIFSYLERRLNFDDGTNDIAISSMMDRFSFFLSQWILGHEIGHIVLWHKIGQYYFSNDSVQNDSNKSLDETSYSMQESAADSFSVKFLNAGERQNAYWFWLGLSNMISTSYPLFLTDWLNNRDSTVDKPVFVEFNLNQHPPWILRYLDMVQLLLKMFPDLIFDTTGYFESIRKRIHLVQTNNQKSYPFCDDRFASQDSIRQKEKGKNTKKDVGKDDDGYEWNYKRGTDFYYTNNFEKAKSEFQKAISKLKKRALQLDNTEKQTLGTSFFYMGLLFLLEDSVNTSLANLKASLQYIKTADVYKYLALCYLAQQDDESAAEYISKALSLNKFDELSYLLMSIYYTNSNAKEKALEAFNYAVLIDSTIIKPLRLRYNEALPSSLINRVKEVNSKYSTKPVISLLENEKLFNFIYEGAYSFYIGNEFDKAEKKVNELVESIQQSQHKSKSDSLRLADIYNFEGMISNAKQEENSAIKFYNLSLEIKNRLNFSNINFLKGQTNYNIGNIYFKDSNYVSTLFYYKKADSCYALDTNKTANYIFEKTKLSVNLGSLYLTRLDVVNGLKYHISAIKNYSALVDSGALSIDDIFSLVSFDIESLLKISKKERFNENELSSIKNYQLAFNKIIKDRLKNQSAKLLEQTDSYFFRLLSKDKSAN